MTDETQKKKCIRCGADIEDFVELEREMCHDCLSDEEDEEELVNEELETEE